jgi:hypothetical protein
MISCGMVWFLHIGKTGGGTVKTVLQVLSRQGWKHYDHFADSRPYCRGGVGGIMRSPRMEAWNSSRWRVVLRELQTPKPRILVNYHSCPPGFATLLPQLADIEDGLRQKGCSLLLTTMLREPVARMQSHLNWWPVRTWLSSNLRSVSARLADYQTKFIMFGGERFWPDPYNTTRGSPATDELRANASAVLSRFGIVGRTENLSDFVRCVQTAIGHTPNRRPSALPHVHALSHRRSRNLLTPDRLWIAERERGDSELYHMHSRAHPC